MITKKILLLTALTAVIPVNLAAQEMMANDNYLPSLITETPYEGRQLAMTIVRKTIGTIQTDVAAKHRVRAKYAEDPQLLMNAAELVAIEFKTIAIANDYWRK
ncbi:Hexameric tyrosine-coordinated heme protein (HTHP) [Methylophaga frappieri]|uniref:Hexameric tyrosine-coordinated heme protein (HTHP) n=1 Tax=Methylophaga frappieri (strain ATCC BAA-2434 / DSM 25690 / JAM7) TaxID=754477 RepID=I1YJS6_METFJ|nr:hexameric tyrosine-coordinated heme protein [Methylophaga frappieri]AFJ03169.1 Hexameric tyrosine-coordinated heme protein (HTHP) [Methylophaga frappieri]